MERNEQILSMLQQKINPLDLVMYGIWERKGEGGVDSYYV